MSCSTIWASREDEMDMIIRPDCADLPVFLARLFCLQDGTAVRLLEVHARRRRPAAAMRRVVEHPEFGLPRRRSTSAPASANNPDAVASVSQSAEAAAPKRLGSPRPSAQYLRAGRRRRAFRIGANGGERQQQRLLSGAADARDAAPGRCICRSVRPCFDAGKAHRRRPPTRPASSSPSTGSLTARSRASVSGAAISCSCRIPRSAARASSASGRSCATIAARCGGSATRRSRKDPQYGDFSLEQAKLGIEDFYDRMDDVMSPAPLDPMRAMMEAIASLDEQVKARVTSVENGRKYQNSGHGDVDMPAGPTIFETTGAWEDFATPSRDLRLLIAIDVVRGFPDRVARRPDRYAMPSGPERRRREGRTGARARGGACRRASSPTSAATARRGRSRSRT